ncbi:radical SAM protein [Dehalobacter restrictus]|uniref:SPL family radical SAM protein n=1 Tax=Dehalobacter restrictus TaxID=55583 RepID=UPI00338F907B
MHFAEYKSIISPQNNMNLYRGCTHGCIYCDSRSRCYQINHDFEDIEVKKDAAAILENQLRKRKGISMISTGAMCDPYIHLEEELLVTRQCLEVIERYGFGVCIQTKSNRILRDLALLQRINEKAKCVVAITLTTYDDNLCRIIEPYVSTTSERYEILKECQRVGIPTIVWIDPILPYINDTEENLRKLLDYCIDADVKGIICFGFGLTLREGNREFFYSKLENHFPDLKEKYIANYANKYECYSFNNEYLMNIFSSVCKKHGIQHNIDDIFHFTKEFSKNSEQISLFDTTN